MNVLVILDGATEPPGEGPSCLEQAHTPTLDRLRAEGVVTQEQHVAPGLPAGSECAICALLGWTPPAPVDRAALEAAARGLPLEGARRVDAPRGADTAPLIARLRAHGARVEPIGGHRLLCWGELPDDVNAWPQGVVPPRVLDPSTVMVAEAGAAAGAAALLGARVILSAERDLATHALSVDAKLVVVHANAPDEAAHERDRPGKIAALERLDRELLAPLAARADTLTVAVDHGCDPATGEHDALPVPHVVWQRA